MDTAIRQRHPDPRPCAFDDCEREAKTRGYCGGHYRQLAAGETLRPLQVQRKQRKRNMTDSELLAWIPDQCRQEGDCLIWQGSKRNSAGNLWYAQFGYRGKPQLVHTFLLEQRHERAKQPEEYCRTTCGNTLCCNVDHLVWRRIGETRMTLDCTFDGCTKKQYAKGLCNAHRRQQRLGQELHPLRYGKQKDQQCAWPPCKRPARAKGLCMAHYEQQRNGMRLATFEPRKTQAQMRQAKAQAVIDVLDTGMSCNAAARKNGICKSAVYDAVKQADADRAKDAKQAAA